MKYLFALCLLFAFGCNTLDKNECELSVNESVVAVSAPLTVQKVDSVFNIAVTVPVRNGCGTFKNFKAIDSSNYITVIPVVEYKGCVCTQVSSTQSLNFPFRANTPGNYYFRFMDTAGYTINVPVAVTL